MLKGSVLAYLPSLCTDICIRFTHMAHFPWLVQREPASCYIRKELMHPKQKGQRLDSKLGSSLCDWTFALHLPDYFKKLSFLL